MTLLYRRTPDGTLAPYAAQHKTPCGPAPAPQPRPRPQPARPAVGIVSTAYRPGKCAACLRDIIPGDKITCVDGDGTFVHFECAPTEAALAVEPVPRPERRRQRSRQGC